MTPESKTAVSLTFLLSIALSLMGVLLVTPLLNMMDTPEDVFSEAYTYLTIYFAGMLGLLVYNMGSGILRAVGASKKDVSRVFNAETFIVGMGAGLVGIGMTLILIVPINAILLHFTGLEGLKATLPVAGGVALIIISALLTIFAGLIPSRVAAKKDPVVALRTE